MWGRGKRNKVIKYGQGPRRVRRPWALRVLATPLDVSNLTYLSPQKWEHPQGFILHQVQGWVEGGQ